MQTDNEKRLDEICLTETYQLIKRYLDDGYKPNYKCFENLCKNAHRIRLVDRKYITAILDVFEAYDIIIDTELLNTACIANNNIMINYILKNGESESARLLDSLKGVQSRERIKVSLDCIRNYLINGAHDYNTNIFKQLVEGASGLTDDILTFIFGMTITIDQFLIAVLSSGVSIKTDHIKIACESQYVVDKRHIIYQMILSLDADYESLKFVCSIPVSVNMAHIFKTIINKKTDAKLDIHCWEAIAECNFISSYKTFRTANITPTSRIVKNIYKNCDISAIKYTIKYNILSDHYSVECLEWLCENSNDIVPLIEMCLDRHAPTSKCFEILLNQFIIGKWKYVLDRILLLLTKTNHATVLATAVNTTYMNTLIDTFDIYSDQRTCDALYNIVAAMIANGVKPTDETLKILNRSQHGPSTFKIMRREMLRMITLVL
ncbi:MAG: hypothetical protein Faunusvirus7_14 [Faunusvirus sp.]|jgi:hypothetical protein|uniref:Uncharacterized protein n=1 Tax=Faunusvirus sp. TaxID=2487766 RepID=A0A3G4ZWJ5_9VIRU|nr:MAG: hypothetical protein Faunusvirus7_14 [Faunusvirus sp.]